MTTKLYRVLVEWSEGADVCIKAESEEEARRQALILVENGRASYQLDQSNSSGFRVADAQEVETPEDIDKKDAGENAEAWTEYKAE